MTWISNHHICPTHTLNRWYWEVNVNKVDNILSVDLMSECFTVYWITWLSLSKACISPAPLWFQSDLYAMQLEGHSRRFCLKVSWTYLFFGFFVGLVLPGVVSRETLLGTWILEGGEGRGEDHSIPTITTSVDCWHQNESGLWAVVWDIFMFHSLWWQSLKTMAINNNFEQFEENFTWRNLKMSPYQSVGLPPDQTSWSSNKVGVLYSAGVETACEK